MVARLKETSRYKMAGADALKTNVRKLMAKNLLNIATEKQDGKNEDSNLGKRDPFEQNGGVKEKSPNEQDQSFVRRPRVISHQGKQEYKYNTPESDLRAG